ncbi:MAG: type VII toxin-antitoxin system MntA family adenylyltransferase antitoxin [Chloroflexota bacterium]
MSTTPPSSDIQLARDIVMKHLRPFRVKVYLFGSQARGTADLFSDIDIALLPEETLPAETLAELKEKLEESNILRQVDVVDLSETDEAFRQKVLKEGIL